jgi:hypothetical protein
MMSWRLRAGGGGAIVTQTWVTMPAPLTSKSVRFSPGAMFGRLSPFPPVVS